MHTCAHTRRLTVSCFLFLVAMAIPAASPWLVNELGEALCTVVAPPPYSYDPNGNDLPRGQHFFFQVQSVHIVSDSPQVSNKLTLASR